MTSIIMLRSRLDHLAGNRLRQRMIRKHLDRLFEAGAGPEMVWASIRRDVPGVLLHEVQDAARHALRRARLRAGLQMIRICSGLSFVRSLRCRGRRLRWRCNSWVAAMSRFTTIAWGTLDDLLNQVRMANDLVEAIHMAAESHALTSQATGAIQQVCGAATYRLETAMENIEEAMKSCK